MDRPGHETVDFFIGQEVEHTPAHGMKTLFVVGIQPIEEIEKQLEQHQVEHIFFGANHSFSPTVDDFDSWIPWEDMIYHFLRKKCLCTLDIPVTHVHTFHESGFCEYNTFIPQIRISLPYIELWNYNTMVKLDDRDFDSTNPGVWCHSLYNLMARDKFTDWSQYKNDEVV